MRIFKADLHIHTKLSPCASEEMNPRAIAEKAKDLGLEIIAICDHNASGNSAAVMEAASPHGIVVIPGIEVETRERIHLIALFPDVERAMNVAADIALGLPDIDARYTTHYGEQILLAADGSVRGRETKALAFPARFSLRAAVELIKREEGLAIPAHVERPSFSVYSQLGDIPRDIRFDAIEVSPANQRPVGLREKFARYGWAMVGSSDSHYLSELGRARSDFMLERPSFEEIRLALHGRQGRSVTLA